MNNFQNTINETVNLIKKELAGIYPEREIQSFIFIIFEEIANFSRVDLYSKADSFLAPESIGKINNIISKLKVHEPIQYIFGKTNFYSLPYILTPDVLIPRPETEELVDWIIQETGNRIVRILDIGTGSGCIAVALNKNIFRSKVDAFDVSEKALKIAEENAFYNNAFINFEVADILKWKEIICKEKYDIIVSNPPYVRESEKNNMQPNVLNYEPSIALFVSNDDPLIYYKAIIDFAKIYLKDNGQLYFEINENFSNEINNLLLTNGFSDICLKKDLQGKFRMIRGGR